MSVTILAVDDEMDVADLFRQHFRREVRQGQYVLHFACSGEDALGQLAKGIEPQLIVILSDINMPGMDGLVLLREIKQKRPDLPVKTAHEPWVLRSQWVVPISERALPAKSDELVFRECPAVRSAHPGEVDSQAPELPSHPLRFLAIAVQIY